MAYLLLPSPPKERYWKLYLNSRPLFLFDRNEIKIASRQWNGIHVDQVMFSKRTAATFFQPSLAWLRSFMRFWCVRFLFHVTWRFIYVHAWRPKYCIANGIFTVAAVTIKCELPISIHNRWPEWLALLTNGH